MFKIQKFTDVSTNDLSYYHIYVINKSTPVIDHER